MERKSTLPTWEKLGGGDEGKGGMGGEGKGGMGGREGWGEGGGRGGEFNLARRNFSSLTNFPLGVI